LPHLAVLSVLSAASSPCPDLNLIHYRMNGCSRIDETGNLKQTYLTSIFQDSTTVIPAQAVIHRKT